MSQGLVRWCPQGFYRENYTSYDAPAGQICLACKPGITTQVRQHWAACLYITAVKPQPLLTSALEERTIEIFNQYNILFWCPQLSMQVYVLFLADNNPEHADACAAAGRWLHVCL